MFILSNEDEKAPLSCLLFANNTMDMKLTEKPTAKQTQKFMEVQIHDCSWKCQITCLLKCNSNKYLCIIKYSSRQGHRYCSLKSNFAWRCTDYSKDTENRKLLLSWDFRIGLNIPCLINSNSNGGDLKCIILSKQL